MATGITKREQLTPDAISAQGFYGDGLPLPVEGEDAHLAYSHKASLLDVMGESGRSFLCVTNGGAFSSPTISENSFVLDDNFYALKELIQFNRKATLFYLDPPYGTGLDFHSRSLEHAYNDSMGQATYIEFMRRRLILMRECMTDDGSIYVHIGHQMLAHLKIVMDEIFGSENFRNIITRRKCSSKNFTSKQYANLNDFILFYSKGRNYKWSPPGVEAEDDWIVKEYPHTDEIGRRYKLVPIHAPGTRNGETGLPWEGMLPPPGKHWQYTPRKLDELNNAGDIYWSRNGNPRRKVYWTSDRRRTLSDYWDNYRDAHHQSIKVSGYPTEKNLEMIKVIVSASSADGDLVVDPFCGSGTTLQAAQELRRRFIGIDASFMAAKCTLRRMRHGLEAMGDYVKKPKSNNQPNLPLLKGAGATMIECAFYADARLYEKYRAEIDTIAAT